MSNFWTRTITGLSMVFILLAAIWFSGWVFATVFLVITVLGLREFYSLISENGAAPQKLFGTISGAVIFLTYMFINYIPALNSCDPRIALLPVIVPFPLIFLSFIIELYRKKANPLTNVAYTILGIIYIAVPLTLLITFASPDVLKYLGLPVILVGYFAFTWIYDTGAYLVGMQFGKYKFFERISPKKTWEGTIGGAILTLLTALFFSSLVSELEIYDWLILSLLVIVFGSFGDLTESLFKRSLNIKDSGTILPGHGGILDRFDTMLISSPFVFLYFFLRNLI